MKGERLVFSCGTPNKRQMTGIRKNMVIAIATVANVTDIPLFLSRHRFRTICMRTITWIYY